MRLIRVLFPLLVPLVLLTDYLNAGGWWFRSGVTLSCLVLVVCTWLFHSRRQDLVFVMLAFLFSLAGDAVLGRYYAHPTGFVAGVILFLFAHLSYIRYSLFYGSPNRTVFWLLLVVFLSYYFICLMPVIHPWPVSLAVLVYIFISILSLSAACGMEGYSLEKWLFVAGIASLLFSDMLISLNMFMGISDLHWMMMPTYFASQIFVTASVLCSGTKR